jgi:hypothetical protein
MKHPIRDEWMAYLYGELPPEKQAELHAHLHVCDGCQADVERWRSAMKQLDAWELPDVASPHRWHRPLVKWSAAALFMLALGLAGVSLAPSRTPDVSRLRLALLPALRQQLRDEFSADLRAALSDPAESLTNDFRRLLRSDLDRWASATVTAATLAYQQQLARFAETYETARNEDRQALLDALQSLDLQHRADAANLRRDLETVAIVSEDRFRRAQDEIVQLAAYTQPDSAAKPTRE